MEWFTSMKKWKPGSRETKNLHIKSKSFSHSVSWFAWDVVAPIATSLFKHHLFICCQDHGCTFPCSVPFSTSGCFSHTNHSLSQGFDHAPQKWACVYATHPFYSPFILVVFTRPFVHMSRHSHASLSSVLTMGQVLISPSLHSSELLLCNLCVHICYQL